MKADEEAARQERLKNVDDYTVFVSGIHPKVQDRDLFEFFSYVGQVEDIQVVKDPRTRKSKGLSYVEFREKDSVHKAVALTGQLICGYPVTVETFSRTSRRRQQSSPLKMKECDCRSAACTRRRQAKTSRGYSNPLALSSFWKCNPTHLQVAQSTWDLCSTRSGTML